ncbi:MAG: hypothetical protein PW735_01850, partial [Acidobacteriaceae bacterium]|nr:hypothetical protein [Acidobacteriaceae bacterium]
MKRSCLYLVLLLIVLSVLGQAMAEAQGYQQPFWVNHNATSSPRSSHVEQKRINLKNAQPKAQGERVLQEKKSAETTGKQEDLFGVFSAKQDVSSPWAIVLGLTLLTMIPAMLLAMTPMVRLLVVSFSAPGSR